MLGSHWCACSVCFAAFVGVEARKSAGYLWRNGRENQICQRGDGLQSSKVRNFSVRNYVVLCSLVMLQLPQYGKLESKRLQSNSCIVD